MSGKNRKTGGLIVSVLALLLVLFFGKGALFDDKAASPVANQPAQTRRYEETSQTPAISEDGSYTSKGDVALYLTTYGHLPDNFITKKEAEKLGWHGGSLKSYAPGKSIGGDHFGNYEGLLPDGQWRECDIDYTGGSRGAKRLIYAEDVSSIYYTHDHYESFERLY